MGFCTFLLLTSHHLTAAMSARAALALWWRLDMFAICFIECIFEEGLAPGTANLHGRCPKQCGSPRDGCHVKVTSVGMPQPHACAWHKPLFQSLRWHSHCVVKRQEMYCFRSIVCWWLWCLWWSAITSFIIFNTKLKQNRCASYLLSGLPQSHTHVHDVKRFPKVCYHIATT